jgi:DNA-binding NtrC family response regulator
MGDSTPAPKPPPYGPVAIVDDDPTARRLMCFWLNQAGYQTVEYAGGHEVLEDKGDVPLIACVDLGLEDVDGLRVIKHLGARDADLPMIVVTAQREVETAVLAMQAGAYDYVTKPLDRTRLLHAVGRAKERRELVTNLHRLEHALSETQGMSPIIGQSPKMQELARQVERVLPSDVAVCVFGESGTGKELVARAVCSAVSSAGILVTAPESSRYFAAYE